MNVWIRTDGRCAQLEGSLPRNVVLLEESEEVLSLVWPEGELTFPVDVDFYRTEVADLDELARVLAEQRHFTDALDLCLVLLDGDLSDGLRLQVGAALDEVLEVETTKNRLLDVLYAHPVHTEVLMQARRIVERGPATRTLELLTQWSQDLWDIGRLSEATETVVNAWFQDAEEQESFVGTLTVKGLFRELVLCIGDSLCLDEVFERLLLDPDLMEIRNSRGALTELLSALREVALPQVTRAGPANALQVVIVDDDLAFVAAFRTRLEQEWLALGYDAKLDFVEFPNPQDALPVLAGAINPPHVVISEIRFPTSIAPEQGSAPLRTDVLATAATAGVPVRLALTRWVTAPPVPLREEAAIAGTSSFQYKEELRSAGAFRELCQRIYRGLVEVGAIEHLPVSYARSDLLTKSAISEVGAGTIAWLYSQLFPSHRADHLELKLITPGASGAYLMRVQAEQPALIKFSRDRFELAQQVEGQPVAGQLSSRVYLDITPHTPREIPGSMGWYAVAYAYDEALLTLRDWLFGDPPKEDVKTFVQTLFLQNGLTGFYEASVRSTLAPAVMDALRPSLVTRAAFAREARALQPLIEEVGALGSHDYAGAIDRLDGFINAGQVGAEPSPSGVMQYRCHGDLRSDNILVTHSGAMPVLIDLRGRYCHWASDVARLLVDLMVTCYDGPVAMHRWERVNLWVDLLTALAARRDVAPLLEHPHDSGPSLTAASWLSSNLETICPVIRSRLDAATALWEFQAAVCMELLTAVARLDVSPPKRVASFLSALQVLDMAEDSLRSRRQSHR